MRFLAFAVLAAACGGGGGGGGGGGKVKPVGPAIDEKKAEKEAKSLASEILETLERGNKDNLFTLLDDSLIVFGPRRTDAASNRTDALVALGEVIDPKAKKKLALRSSSLDVVASSGGRSAWAFDVIDIDGEPHAITAILSNADDLWLVEAALVAHTPSRGAIKTEQGKDSLVPPGATSKTKIDPDARGAVDKFQKGLLDQASWGTDLASRTDAIVIGPAVGEVTRGKMEIKKLWKKRVEQKTRAVASGDIVASVTKDGQLAWVTAPITMVSEKLEPLPLRAFAVFEKAGNEWTLIALHEALAVDQAGAGAAFKKTLPPAPKEPEIEAEGEKPPKKKAAKPAKDEDPPPKKKKKKKKPKPKDDDE
ncbi:MAG: nuclear transport factor 2 family protein [Deltaproteobacteria bacterium]|nr:nuclear transport factor 2 family protein [Deltaproteobacteria bacterium]